MVERLVGALGKSIKEKWADRFNVYTESVYQSAKKPCFFLECEKAEQMPLLGGRFFLRVVVKVVLDSENQYRKYEAEEILGDLFSLMKFVSVDTLRLQGRKINGKWENGSFVVRGTYDIFPVEKQEDGCIALMENIEGNGKEVLQDG